MAEKKENPKGKFASFKIRSLTLNERALCSDMVMTEFGKYFTQAITWVKYGLVELKGIPITDENLDEEVNKLETEEIMDIADRIIDATQSPNKKKISS